MSAAVQAAPLAGFPAFSYAFQPIVDTSAQSVFAWEALIRGPNDTNAFTVLSAVPEHRVHEFDHASRAEAIALAAKLGVPCNLNLNFLPRGLFLSTNAIAATLDVASRHALPIERITLEVTEGEVIDNHAQFATVIDRYRGRGLKVAIDDFGAGYAGLNLLAAFKPDQVKIDMRLVRGIERDGARQSIVRAIIQVCEDLGIDVVAEGVETLQEYAWLAANRVSLFQGYLFARPGFEHYPEPHFPVL